MSTIPTPKDTGGAAAAAAGARVVRRREALPTRLTAAAVAAAAAALALAFVTADPALAQQGAGIGDINSAITKVRNGLATLIVSAGGVALLIAVLVWLFSGADERRRSGALRWIGHICVAIVVGLSVPAIIAFLQSVAGGGGGG